MHIFLQDNQTPLHYASKNGHIEVAQVLLSHGATVDMKDSRVSSIECSFLKLLVCVVCVNYCNIIIHQTPLHYASKHGHSEVVQVLLSHGATVDMKDRVRKELPHIVTVVDVNGLLQALIISIIKII